MPNLEHIPEPQYQPHLINLEQIAEHEDELTDKEKLLELARQKYILGFGTLELKKQSAMLPGALKYKDLIDLVALADLDEQDLQAAVEEFPESEREEKLKDIKLIKEYKDKITH